ncbi:MAG: hypothetical protein ACLQVD_11700 [Capsulimonadaceae bacterium]
MRIAELYPYWDDVHEDLIGCLEYLDAGRVETKPHPGASSIRQIVLEFAEAERFYGAHLVTGARFERPSSAEYPDGPALIGLLNAARSMTALALDPIEPAGLRAVRLLPADPTENRPETNVTVAWLFWHVLELSIACLARVKLRLADEKVKKPAGRWE